jgi:S-formylglutathione hydrolase FrmB
MCAGAPAAHAQRIAGERALENGGIELTIATPALTAPTRVQVFLPAGYGKRPKRRWPVTYYLHGAQGNEARFYPWFGKLIKDFPSIVVAPDGGQLGFYSDWYNAGAGGPPMYETYDIDQLIKLIDGRFRTIRRRAGRAVIGESMGGYGVMTYAARHPDVFAAAASLSGAVDSNYVFALALITAGPPIQGGLPDAIYGSRATQEIRWHGHNPTDLAANLRDVDLQVRTAEGSPNPPAEGGDPSSAAGCTIEHGIFDMNVSFHGQLQALRVPHVWKDYGAGCHSIPIFQREFADSLPGLVRVFAHPRRPPRTFSYRSIEPRFAVWGWRVQADPARALEFLQLRDAGRRGLTLVGSGTTRMRTPRFFRGRKAVDVVIGDQRRTVAPGRAGRLRFSVDLGTPHADQQDTPGATDDFTTRTVRFHAR